MWGEGSHCVIFRGSSCAPTLYQTVPPFFADLTRHCSHMLNFQRILGALALCSVPQISLPLALRAHTVLLWGRAASFGHMWFLQTYHLEWICLVRHNVFILDAFNYCQTVLQDVHSVSRHYQQYLGFCFSTFLEILNVVRFDSWFRERVLLTFSLYHAGSQKFQGFKFYR